MYKIKIQRTLKTNWFVSFVDDLLTTIQLLPK